MLPVRRGLAELRRLERPAQLLGLAVAVWVAVFGVLVWQLHDRFGTYAFDLGIHDQAIWLMARGKSFVTIRGLDALGHHATFAYWLLAPLSWLGAGPHVWNLLQVLTVGLGAVPVYVLARTRLPGLPWVALALAGAWLLQPSVQFLLRETFHPEVMAATPLMAAYVAGERGAWRAYAVFLLLALLWKEDVALAVVMLGLLQLLRRRWRVGALTAVAGAVWLACTVALVVPAQNDGRTFYGEFYGDLGDTPLEVVGTGLTDPSAILDRLADNDALGYIGELLAPTAFIALAAPEVLALGVPQAFVNLLSVHAFTHDRRYHYVVLPLAAVMLATVEGVARLARVARARWGRGRARVVAAPLAGVVLVVAGLSTWAWGLAPGSRKADVYWASSGDPTVPALRRAVALVPDGAGVSAGQRAAPHLTHREVVYTFPNPWQPGPSSTYGIDPDERGDPAQVGWLVVSRPNLLPEDSAVLARVLASGAFAVRFDEAGVVVAERVRPPGRATSGI